MILSLFMATRWRKQMDSMQFCYWLQGLFELADPKILTEKQLEVIKEHLNLVFTKQTTTKYDSRKDSIYNNPRGMGIMTCGLGEPSQKVEGYSPNEDKTKSFFKGENEYVDVNDANDLAWKNCFVNVKTVRSC